MRPREEAAHKPRWLAHLPLVVSVRREAHFEDPICTDVATGSVVERDGFGDVVVIQQLSIGAERGACLMDALEAVEAPYHIDEPILTIGVTADGRVSQHIDGEVKATKLHLGRMLCHRGEGSIQLLQIDVFGHPDVYRECTPYTR